MQVAVSKSSAGHTPGTVLESETQHQTAGEDRPGLRDESLLGLRVFWFARIMFLSHGTSPLFCLATR